MPKKPYLTKKAFLEQVVKLRGVQVGKVAKLVSLLQDMNNRYRKDNPDVLIDRRRLATMALDAHPDDVARMLIWAIAVESNGIKRRAEKESVA